MNPKIQSIIDTACVKIGETDKIRKILRQCIRESAIVGAELMQRKAAEATVGYVENPIQAEVQVSAHAANDIRCKINGLRLSDVIS